MRFENARLGKQDKFDPVFNDVANVAAPALCYSDFQSVFHRSTSAQALR
ncbi:hypothetical protein X738_18220 [Mesorhizobium sp. LNHC209A00]|nr:hypothetical protein X738_18220 [Mesorhizobium sp. LNHC209A00]